MVGHQKIRIACHLRESAGGEYRVHGFVDTVLEHRIAVDARIAGGFLRLVEPRIGFQTGEVGLRIVVVADLHRGAARDAGQQREGQKTTRQKHRCAQLRTFHNPSLFLHMLTMRVALTCTASLNTFMRRQVVPNSAKVSRTVSLPL